MEGKRNLNLLPDAFKEKIISRYGSIDKFYNLVYNSAADYYMAFVVEKDENKKKALENFRYQTVLELEKMARSVGLDIDGADIYDDISDDFDEQLVKINLNKYAPKP